MDKYAVGVPLCGAVGAAGGSRFSGTEFQYDFSLSPITFTLSTELTVLAPAGAAMGTSRATSNDRVSKIDTSFFVLLLIHLPPKK